MLNQDSKIIVNDISKKIETSRSKLMSENPSLKKPLIFKGYKTEKDRIQKNIQNNRFLHNYQNYSFYKKKSIKYLKNKILSLSPISKNNLNKNFSLNGFQLNFNSINKIPSLNNKGIDKENIKSHYSLSPFNKKEKSLSKKEKKTINYHIKNNLNEKLSRINNIDILNSKRHEDFLEEKINFSDSDIFQKEYRNKKSIIKSKNIYAKNNKKTKNNKLIHKSWTRRHILKEEKENILKPYHYKIHFKAAEEIAENKTKKNFKNKYLFLLPNLFKEKHHSKNNDEKNMSFEDNEFNKEENEAKNNEENYYDGFYYQNPLKKITEYSPELMSKISELAFKKETFPNENKIYNKKKYIKKINLVSNLNDENEIEIDGKTFSKISQFDLIANKILKSCNVYNNKSLFNNINLKARSGKTMITQGMSINEFEKKYGLK